MLENLSVSDIFPTPVWTIDLAADVAGPMNAKLMTAIEALLGGRPPIPPGANWQTDPVLHTRPEFAAFTKLAERAGRAAAQYLKLPARDLAVTGCWANVNPPGGRNTAHTHPNNYLSGVYYVAMPAGEGRIVFEDPRPAAAVMMPRVAEFTPHNANSMTFEVKPGRMVLFPAWLTHSVPVNRSTQERVSIAFNLMFTQFVGHESAPLWEGTVTAPGRVRPSVPGRQKK